MPNFNKVYLMGNLTKDPELRHTATGTAVADLRLAVNRWYKANGENESKKESDFFTVVVWSRQAETCSQYLQKGSPLFVEGRLTSKTWEGTDGIKKHKTEVIASKIQFLNKNGTPSTSRAFEETLSDKKSEKEEAIPF